MNFFIEIFNYLSLVSKVVLVIMFFAQIILFIYLDLFYNSIKYKSNIPYIIDFIIHSEKIRIKKINNEIAKKYYSRIIMLSIISFIGYIYFMIILLFLNG